MIVEGKPILGCQFQFVFTWFVLLQKLLLFMSKIMQLFQMGLATISLGQNVK
jgi:hypothetical protein